MSEFDTIQVDATERSYETCLLESTQLLLDNGADVDSYDGIALTYACSREGSLRLAKMLLDNGADVNINNGKPLYTAITSNNPEMVTMLLDNGADVTLDNYKALKWASIFGYKEIVQMLLFHATNFWIEKESDYLKVQESAKNGSLPKLVENIKTQMNG